MSPCIWDPVSVCFYLCEVVSQLSECHGQVVIDDHFLKQVTIFILHGLGTGNHILEVLLL